MADTAPGRHTVAAAAALAWHIATVPEACKARHIDLQERAAIHDSVHSAWCGLEEMQFYLNLKVPHLPLSMAALPLTYCRSSKFGLEQVV